MTVDRAFDGTKSFHETVRDRRSCRAFLARPVARDLLAGVLADAQLTPSNCNTQPWVVHIVSGAARDALASRLGEMADPGMEQADFGFDQACYGGLPRERLRAQGQAYYEALGIPRDDRVLRQAAGARNLSFFGAPHVAFLFMPSVSDDVRVAADVGMYAQTFLLALAARGLGGIPQTSLARFAGSIRAALGIRPELKLLFGISFGWPDDGHPSTSYRQGRAPIDECVAFHE